MSWYCTRKRFTKAQTILDMVQSGLAHQTESIVTLEADQDDAMDMENLEDDDEDGDGVLYSL